MSNKKASTRDAQINPRKTSGERKSSPDCPVRPIIARSTGEFKACSACGDTLPLSRYYRNGHMADGHVSTCKKCAIDMQTKRNNDRIKRLGNEYHIEYRHEPRKYIQNTKGIDWHIIVYGGQKAHGRRIIGGISA